MTWNQIFLLDRLSRAFREFFHVYSPSRTVLSKVISPLPLGERVRVRGKKTVSWVSLLRPSDLSPPPLPSPLKGEGFPYLSVYSRAVFHKTFDNIDLLSFFTKYLLKRLARSFSSSFLTSSSRTSFSNLRNVSGESPWSNSVFRTSSCNHYSKVIVPSDFGIPLNIFNMEG